ncbi:MAG: hypothetical protein IJ530_12235 [Treponema sp.]|uniref:hypothetical protein n=1 Tax=Treponema sp. TaxID=166 RepID=UPI0025E4E60E|nr:hypothetical protein [Treponema sp.]MBQ8680512.1 hypothetical protein [Treponema sp.]
MLHSVFFCFIALFSFSLFSCAESEADVVSASATAVFDYSDSESLPSVRLAVFVQVTSDIQRADNFTISNTESGYTWSVAKPGIFTGLNKSYAYSLNLNVPEGDSFPTGEYMLLYKDAAGSEDSIRFSVNYDKELLSANSTACKKILSNVTENVAVYDASGELLFMGKAKSSWKNNDAILRDYKLARTKRICYVAPGNSIICMMPAEKLKTEN